MSDDAETSAHGNQEKAGNPRTSKLRDALETYKYVTPRKSPRHSRQGSQTLHRSQRLGTTFAGPSTEAAVSVLEPDYAQSPRRSKRRRSTSVMPLEPSPSPTKRGKKPKRTYAPPETYQHLRNLQDHLIPSLDVVFCGINPGYKSAQTGCHYAHSTNHFWQCLHHSGLTDRLLSPNEANVLLEEYNFGLTNLVDRPTAEQSELSPDEMRQGVPVLINKLARYRPRVICFLGKGIWEIFRTQALKLRPQAAPSPGRSPRKAGKARQLPDLVASKYFDAPTDSPQSTPEHAHVAGPLQTSPASPVKFSFGLQPLRLVHQQNDGALPPVTETLVFVFPSPSARVVAYQLWDKVKMFEELRKHLASTKKNAMDISQFAEITLPPMHTIEPEA